MIKRILCVLLTAVLLISMTACTSVKTSDVIDTGNKETVTPMLELPKYENETVELNNIKDYTIVYPSDYTDYRKKDVEFLQKTIKDVTGASLKVISDLEEASGKEIIIASSKRKNGVEEALEKLPHGLDYVVAVRNGNIVLGGNNYYADIRAIYDFINNTLGYDDITEEKGTAKTGLCGVNYVFYEKPQIIISGNNGSCPPFLDKASIKDVHDANFNMLAIADKRYNDEQLHNVIKWCALYDVLVMLAGNIDRNEMYIDCPAVWGHALADEPLPENYVDTIKICDEYIDKYGKYGWQAFCNFMIPDECLDPLLQYTGFDRLSMFSVDTYPGHSVIKSFITLRAYEKVRQIARLNNSEVWTYIESYNVKNRNQNTSKMFRWHTYFALSIGSKSIIYFQYGDASKNYTAEGDWSFGSLINWDFTKNPSWYDAQTLNRELLDLAPVYNRYKSAGVYIANNDVLLNEYGEYYKLNDPYAFANDIISDLREPDEENRLPLFMGFFDKTDNSNAHAFTIVNMEDLNDKKYEEDAPYYVEMKIEGENVKFYRNGKQQSVDKTDDGYYRINMANGFCWFVTVD